MNVIKFVLFGLIFATSIVSFSQEVEKQTQEDSMIYFRDGKSIVNFDSKSKSAIVNSLGYIRYSGVFMYGAEFTSNYIKESQIRFLNYQISAGYRHLWTKSVLPYAMIQIGYSSFKNEDPTLESGEGVSRSVDMGLDIYKLWKVKTSIGFKTTNMNFNNQLIQSANSNDLYLMIGFVF